MDTVGFLILVGICIVIFVCLPLSLYIDEFKEDSKDA